MLSTQPRFTMPAKDYGFNISLPSTETSLDFEAGERCLSPYSNDETLQPYSQSSAKGKAKITDKHRNFELKLKTEVTLLDWVLYLTDLIFVELAL